MTIDEQYMARCLQLARKGKTTVSPNPMVGAVVVCDGKIIGEGYHIRCGEGHAEVNAIRSVKDTDKLAQSTLYVNLEPCSHFGKTPPCSDLIIEKGIPRVVVGCYDKNRVVNGRGIAKLQAAGVQVITGVLEKECEELNRRFFTVQEKQRPYIVLKWAQSADGFIDVQRNDGSPFVFSSPCTRMMVHRLRAQSDAIMVGRCTAMLDNPSLTTRYWHGRNPLRIVVDRQLVLPQTLQLFDGSVPTLVVTEKGDFPSLKNVSYLTLDFKENILSPFLATLVEKGIQRLLVEGGAKLLQSFIDEELWDEAYVEQSSVSLNSGIAAPYLSNEYLNNVKSCFGTSFFSFGR